ncbi:YfjI family protein [Paraburkholderia sp. FT54]|uniref:YfjI family protein n=1 Tax=Paraburkholderia sp. FT54 TaxID=3074437 RepID=UPI0028772C46|nr:YfjI family protein [Paraburkholderia sp. FT54]WNC90516.1 YfjI family protein [Paraburkholderia sp. FT54]
MERLDIAAMGLPVKGDIMDWLEMFKATHDRMPTADDVLALPKVGQADNGPSDGWPDPQPLTETTEPLEYPVESLPPCIRAAVDEVCGFVQAPLPLVASSAIAALSLAIQAHADVKRAERLTGPVGLFMLTIADSGERKSTCDGFFTRAIRDYEAEQAEAYKPVQKDHQADMAAWEAKYNGLKEKIKGEVKARKPTIALEGELRDLEHEKPEPPKVPRLIYADVTPEALAFSLGKQWPSGGVVSAEAGIVFGSHGMGSDSVMRNLATLNQLWDGNTLQIDRRTSESFAVRGARLTVALQVQEATIRSFFDKSGTLARGTGFLARFLVAWPQSTQGYRPFREAPEHWPHMATFNQRTAEILSQPVPMDDGGNLAPLMFTLSPEAKAAWVAFHDAVEAQLSAGGDLHDVRDVASKSADNAARLAALFHVFSGATGPVGLESFESAASIVAWHLSESKRFFSELALPDDLANAARLDAWLIEHCRTERTQTVSKRTAQQFGPLRKADPLSVALKTLEELDRLRVERIGKQIVIHINPALIATGGTK